MEQNQVYAEVYDVLTVLGKDYLRKIPQNVLNVIATQRDKTHKFMMDGAESLNTQKLSVEARALLAVLKLDYWCESDEERQQLQALFKLNDEKTDGADLSLDSKKAWIDLIKNKAKRNS